MSDKHLQTRNALTVHTGIFGLSTLGFLGTAIVKLLAGGLGFSGWIAVVLIIIGLMNFRGAWKSFSDMDYGKSNRQGLIASLSSIGAVLLTFM